MASLNESRVANVVHEKENAAAHAEFPEDLRQASHAIQLAEDASAAKYSPWTGPLMRLYGCLLIAYLCGCLNGYDGSLMGGLNAMTTYQKYFHMCAPPFLNICGAWC
jgi:hypothetical protein